MCKGVLPLSFFCPPSNKVSGISDRQVVTNVARGFDDEAFERAAKLLTGNACVCFFFFKMPTIILMAKQALGTLMRHIVRLCSVHA